MLCVCFLVFQRSISAQGVNVMLYASLCIFVMQYKRKMNLSVGLNNFERGKWIRGLVSKETGVLLHWVVETNVWFFNRVDY